MGKPNQATQTKRMREKARFERKEEKRVKRVQRKEMKKDRTDGLPAGIDPDLVGIYPGPQPRLE